MHGPATAAVKRNSSAYPPPLMRETVTSTGTGEGWGS